MKRRAIQFGLVVMLTLAGLGTVAVASVGIASSFAARGCTSTETTVRVSGKTQVVQSNVAIFANGDKVLVQQPDEVVTTTVKTCR